MKSLVKNIITGGKVTNSSTSGTSGISGTFISTSNIWNPPVFQEVKEVGESIEMIYTQTSTYLRTGGLYPITTTNKLGCRN